MTVAVINVARAKRVTVKARPTKDDSRRRNGFDKAAAFATTRREIEKHARHVGAAETDDLSRWLVAWAWFNWRPKDPLWALIMAAYRMGQKGLTEVEAALILEEAGDAPRRMKADALATWLGVTYAERETLRLTRIGACDIGPQARAELRKREHRLRQQRRRREQGAKPRAEWLAANALSRAQPWKAEGISRRQWERRRRKAPEPDVAGPCAADSFSIAAHALATRAKKSPSKNVTRRSLRDTRLV
jgi:hypothetical protein